VACDTPCSVSYRRVVDRSDAIVAVVVETSDVSAATRTIARTLLPGVAVSLIAMVLVSQVVARRVTAPIDRLVLFTREVASEASPQRAESGDDEVGRLGLAFNEMLDRLDQSKRALVRSEKLALAGMLAARLAHDIRNPLSSIKMHTQLLQSRVRGDEHDQTLVTAILRDTGTVEWVIRDLIEFARPGDLKLVPANLNQVVRDVLQQLEARLTHRKIVVEADLAGALPSIPLDVGRFQQALVNVIVNAADAMPNGGRLGVSTQAAPGESTLILEVSDDGVGIDPAILDRVFDPFVSSKPDGVGLGLVNVKAVVEHHGGRIELAARQPRGTRARITLPVRKG
jgi:two-component system sensor histidine kinase HydH